MSTSSSSAKLCCGTAPLDDFSAWIQEEKRRAQDSFPVRLVDRQLLAWLCCMRRALAHRAERERCLAPVAGAPIAARSGEPIARRRNRRGSAGRGLQSLRHQTAAPKATNLPGLVRDIISSFVGDQSGGAVTAMSLRKRAEAARFRDIWCGLLPAFEQSANDGLMSYHINQNIEQLSFWRPWMQEPNATTWIKSCLEGRGFAVHCCKLYHTAYAGYQGCRFFELKIGWSA